MVEMLRILLLCTSRNADRPSMRKVVSMLVSKRIKWLTPPKNGRTSQRNDNSFKVCYDPRDSVTEL